MDSTRLLQFLSDLRLRLQGRAESVAAAPTSDAISATMHFPKFTLLDQVFVIRALILRDLRIRHKHMRGVGFAAEFIMPIVVIVLHYFVFIALGRVMPANIPCELYCLGGFTTWFAFKNTAGSAIRPRDNTPGVFLVPGVTTTHILIASILWETVAMLLLLYVGIGIAQMIFGYEPIPNIPESSFAMFTAAALGAAYKLFFEGLSWVWPMMKHVKNALTWFMFITSGIYVTGHERVLDFLTAVSCYNPLFHLLEPQRNAIWPGYPLTGVSMVYVLAWTLVLFLAGMTMKKMLYMWAER